MKLAFFLATILLSTTAYAAGSFRLDEELQPILKQQPHLHSFVLNNFDTHWTGSANRIGYNVNTRLGGTRIGPYYLNAKPKGTEGEYIFTLVFHTQITYLDQEGEKTTLENAYHIQESLRSIEITPAHPSQ